MQNNIAREITNAVRTAARAAYRAVIVYRLKLRAAIGDVPKYPTIRAAFYEEVYMAVSGYLESGGAVTSYRNQMRRAVQDFFLDGFYRGYVDAGAEETDDEDEQWIAGEIANQVEYVNELFDTLKAIRAGGGVDASAEGDARATGWSGTLDGIYNQGKALGDGNQMLTMRRDPSAPEAQSDPCATCKRWRDKRRSAKKWARDGLLARNGNLAYECGRWEGSCFDEFYTDNGKKWSA